MNIQKRQRKIRKLHRIRIELSDEARNNELSSSDRMGLARAADVLRATIEAMEADKNLKINSKEFLEIVSPS